MGKVIQFPGRTEPVQQDVDGFYEKELSKSFIEDFVDRVGHGLVNELHNNGYDVDEEEFIVRYMYSLEVIKSVLYNSKNLDHILSGMVGKNAREYFEDEVTEQ
tara:strand:- start:1355 stop:1663 length:309 start_codon:yes stop_codon:yes gene_type:complete